MKEKTVLLLTQQVDDMFESGLNVTAYCEANNMNTQSFYHKIQEYKRQMDHSTAAYNELIEKYNAVASRSKGCKYNKVKLESMTEEPEESVISEEVDSANTTEVHYERNSEDKIVHYCYKIYRRNKAPLIGKMSRDEMNMVYRLYSYYGASLTQREISRYFPDLSLFDFKRILSAMGIYKASCPFAPHIVEETPTEELRNMQLREKENDFLRKIEEDRVRNNEKLLKKYAAENVELKQQIDKVKSLQLQIQNFEPLVFEGNISPVNEYINLYIADMHIGAVVESGTLYKENIGYGVNEANRRLKETIKLVRNLGTFEIINICLMGDMIDCCGPTNKTARLDHSLPENMDGFEQANGYISVIKAFVQDIASANLCNHINLYSVRCGNHTGPIEYIATRALFAELRGPKINTQLFNDFFGVFNVNNTTYVLTHGKDDRFMRKGMPLNVDDKNKTMIYEWLNDNKIYGDNIHIVKGDLHSNNYNSCKRFDYRNVLSLFGASDYSSFNFSRNSYGVSYDLCINGTLMRGEFQNM